MARARQRTEVTVKVGHVAGESREYTLPSTMLVSEMLGRLSMRLEEGEQVIDANANSVQLTETLEHGREYILATNYKAGVF